MELEDLIKKSGDSELIDFSYLNGKLLITLELYQLDVKVRFHIHTGTLYSRPEVLIMPISDRTCYIKLVRLNDVLDKINGFYMAPAELEDLIKDGKAGINLAYGKRDNTAKYLFQIRSAQVIIACLVGSKEDIQYQFIS